MEKNKKIRIVILVLVIIIVAIGGYLIYSNHMTTNFEKNLNEAFVHSEERVDISNEVSADSEILFYTQKEGVRIITDIIKDINKIIKSVDNEIKSLEEAKKYAQTLEEEKYINLQLKLKNNYKKFYELQKEYCEYRVKEVQIALYSEAYEDERNEITDKQKSLNKESEKTIKEIAKLLKDNPDLKQKIENLHLKDSYIGELNYT